MKCFEKKGKLKNVVTGDLFLAILFSTISVLCGYLISGFNVYYSTSDDYVMSLLISSGEINSIYLSWFLTSVLVQIQKIFADINIFVLSQIVLNFCALIIINYVFFKKFSRKPAIFLNLVINALCVSTMFIFVQWTQTTVMLCIAGYLAVICAIKLERKKLYRILQLIFGCIFVVISSWYRWKGFLAVTGIFAIYILCEIIVCIWRSNKTQHLFKASLKYAFKKYFKLALALCLICVFSFAQNAVSASIKSSSEDYNTYYNLNKARSSLIDYEIVEYEGNEEFYNSVDVYSQNDLDFIMTWSIDYDIYTTEKLSAISEYSSQPKFGKRFSVSYVYDLVKNKISETVSVNPNIIIAILSVIIIICLIVLLKFRNKLKYLFPTALLFIWAIYAFIFRNMLISDVLILALPIIAIVALTAFFFNRYHYFIISVLSGAVILLTIYFNFSRIYLRVTYCFLMPVIILMLFMLDKNNLRSGIKKININKRKVLTISFSVIFAATSAVTQFVICQVQYQPGENAEYNNQEQQYGYFVKNHENNYVLSSSILVNYTEPLKTPMLPNNVLKCTGWIVGSQYFLNQKANMELTHVFEDIIDNENTFYVFEKEKFEMTVKYFNDHYAEDDEQIEFEITETIDGIYICSLKTVYQ